jgi:hypothetical protein
LPGAARRDAPAGAVAAVGRCVIRRSATRLNSAPTVGEPCVG